MCWYWCHSYLIQSSYHSIALYRAYHQHKLGQKQRHSASNQLLQAKRSLIYFSTWFLPFLNVYSKQTTHDLCSATPSEEPLGHSAHHCDDTVMRGLFLKCRHSLAAGRRLAHQNQRSARNWNKKNSFTILFGKNELFRTD